MGNKIVWSLLILSISFSACSKSSKNNVARQPTPQTSERPAVEQTEEEDQAKEALKTQNAEFVAANNQLMAEKEKLVNANNQLMAAKEALVNANNQLMAEIEERNNKISDLRNDADKALRTEIEALENRLAIMTFQYDEVKNSYSSLILEHEECIAKNKELASQNVTLISEKQGAYGRNRYA
jgi:chromosome segregation ATPase